MRLRRAARVILVGAPGVGKGTHSERLLHRFPQLQCISSGDLLRNNVKNRTALGIQVESTLKAGNLVSDSIILRVISNEFHKRGWLGQPQVMTLNSSAISPEAEAYNTDYDTENEMAAFMSAMPKNTLGPSADPSASFILDGFPRTALQANKLDDLVPINLAVSITTPFEVLLDRITGRWVHEPSGRVYNTTFNAPKVPGRDDITGEPLVKRVDDDEATYRTRFKKFQETSEPLLEHYARKGVLWEIQGNSSDEISPRLFREFEKRFCE